MSYMASVAEWYLLASLAVRVPFFDSFFVTIQAVSLAALGCVAGGIRRPTPPASHAGVEVTLPVPVPLLLLVRVRLYCVLRQKVDVYAPDARNDPVQRLLVAEALNRTKRVTSRVGGVSVTFLPWTNGAACFVHSFWQL